MSLKLNLRIKNILSLKKMTDFAALRVICYLKQDKIIVTGLLEDNFRIIKREDKSIELGVDRIGS
jgi:ppGpp synthetase/RelA/SpoT-type nucleotidyltranferase